MTISLKEIRKKKGLTQEEVASLAGIHRSYYTRIELGMIPSVRAAKGIEKALGVHWTIFFDEICAKNTQIIKREVI
ncbi:helix-turn-helix transcriptional regulator [Bacillus sp. A301a_S52]|nr:helix-turn-helix transcriptional regulator [Bacillus sp. A301a_S52]